MSNLTVRLIKEKIVTKDQLLAIRQKCNTEKRPVQDLLIEAGYLKEESLFEFAQKVFSDGLVDLDQIVIDRELIKLIPIEKVNYYGVFPVQKEKDILVLAMSDPSDVMVRDNLNFITDLTIKPLLCKVSQIRKYIKKYYRSQDTVHEILKTTISDTPTQLISDERLSNDEIIDLAKANPDEVSFIRLVNKIIHDAIERRASDIHIEPQAEVTDVRYRIDGYLTSVIKVPRELHPRLTARIKILGKLDIAEQKKVQEGRIKVMMSGKEIDLRISVIPIFYGEKIVMRILAGNNAQFDLDKIGMEPDELETYKNAIHKTQGVILVTGPTGSGKTTTLYSTLQYIKNETMNIVTIEDPIECLIEGVNQLQLNRFKDVTFTNGLRSILRQDPDVILVGEIRDKETAEIAFRAALTGHLVFSTLHTNNAASSITRLLDIGLEPYLISSSIILFVAQRLVRLICPECREEYVPDDKTLRKFSHYLKTINIKKFYKGKGCDYCNSSGFYGRISIFEILKVTEKIKALIFNRASEDTILKEAVNSGMRTLVKSGVKKVAAGLTTLEEIAKVTSVLEDQEAQLFSLDSEFNSILKSVEIEKQ
jgi:type IV pilus assembly protein PilB